VDSDRTRWEKRYAAHDLAAPTPPEALHKSGGLDAFVPTAGRALDIACGAGAQTVWLADRGLDVVALDVSPRAIELTTAAAARSDHPSRVDARTHDFDQGLPAHLGVFDVVVCQRFRDPALYGPIIELLGPGGIGIVTVLSAVGLDGEPGAFHATPGELQAAFSTGATEVLGDHEESGVASIVFRRLAGASGGSAV
jgi:SAM-dependent methyltransferase